MQSVIMTDVFMIILLRSFLMLLREFQHRLHTFGQKSLGLRPRLTLSFFTSNGQSFKTTTPFNSELISESMICLLTLCGYCFM